MRGLHVAVLMLALPAWAGQPPDGCAQLCGTWTLDAALSDDAGPLVDAALSTYKEPSPRRVRSPNRNAIEAMEADAERALGPVLDRPKGSELRTELLSWLESPANLELAAQREQITIRANGKLARRVTAGQRHARVDSIGTAQIRASWRSSTTLVISESYSRRSDQSETYALQRDGTLVITREIDRPGMKAIRARSVYRRH